MPNKYISYFIFAVIVLSGLYACKQNTFFESTLEIPGNKWESDKTAVFDFTISDTLQFYNLIIQIANTDNYRNSNLWLFIRTHLSKSEIASDTLEFILSNEKGKWLGEKVGKSWHNDLIYKSKIRFPQTGKYSVEITQGMRDLKLNGIEQIGFKILETE
jgi:gliding motility-associated lipoprotein GldH